MNKEMMEMMLPYLQQLADKMGTSAEYLWKMQLQQAYIDGVSIIAFYIFTFICLAINYKLASIVIKSKGDYENLPVYIAAPPMVLGFLNLFCLVACFFKFSTLITILFNPEYYAFMNLYKLITHSF